MSEQAKRFQPPPRKKAKQYLKHHKVYDLNVPPQDEKDEAWKQKTIEEALSVARSMR